MSTARDVERQMVASAIAPRARILLPVLVAALVLVVLAVTADRSGGYLQTHIGYLVAAAGSIGMAALPVIISVVQGTARARQLQRLRVLEGLPAAQSRYYQAAMRLIDGIKVAGIDGDYPMPVLTLFGVVLVFALSLLFGHFFDGLFNVQDTVLGGLHGLTLQIDQLADFQRGTFVCGMAAFIGSYVYLIGRLLDRINNNDLYPISYHYYSARILTAFAVAIVFRHATVALPFINEGGLVLFGFAIGLTPDLFIVWLARRAYQYVKILGSKPDPDTALQPATLPLSMLDDLSKDKIDRLGELGIDNAQVLACQNPFLVWRRLPYDLGLIVDWIAQGQLYVLVRAEGMQALRKQCVQDVFDLQSGLGDDGARPAVCSALGIDAATATVIARQLEADQSFSRLKEVRDALAVQPLPAAQPPSGGPAPPVDHG